MFRSRAIPQGTAVTVIDFTAFIGRLATASGETILPFFRTSLSIDNKGAAHDFDPVTEADRAAEAVMRRLIKANFPQHGIVGEEFGSEREDAEYVWVLDPIDGTKSFISGFPIWGTLIALLHKGTPVFGMMHQPFIGEPAIDERRRPRRLRPRRTSSAPDALRRRLLLLLHARRRASRSCDRDRTEAL
jgi:fructose-1,6-bisphosphatase/inositol monophosphatase family enzyme